MPQPLAPGYILKNTVVGQAGAQVSLTSIYYVIGTTTGTQPTDLDAAQTMDATLGPLFKAVMSAQSSYLGVITQKIFPLPIFVAQAANANAGVGSTVGNILPTQSRGIISLRSPLAGRAGRGRLYIPFPGVGANGSGGVPVGGYVTNVQAILAAILGINVILGALGGTALAAPILWHRKTNSFTTITGGAAEAKWATQRRSGAFGRPNAVPFPL